MSAAQHRGGGERPVQLRAWLEYVAQQAIDWLDELDAATEDLEDDEREVVTVEEAWP
jgi:hypothetical protein